MLVFNVFWFQNAPSAFSFMDQLTKKDRQETDCLHAQSVQTRLQGGGGEGIQSEIN